jgi:hypothetical protein
LNLLVYSLPQESSACDLFRVRFRNISLIIRVLGRIQLACPLEERKFIDDFVEKTLVEMMTYVRDYRSRQDYELDQPIVLH